MLRRSFSLDEDPIEEEDVVITSQIKGILNVEPDWVPFTKRGGRGVQGNGASMMTCRDIVSTSTMITFTSWLIRRVEHLSWYEIQNTVVAKGLPIVNFEVGRRWDYSNSH